GDVIAAIPQTPGARLVFSGELTLKGARSLVLSQSLQRFNPVTISGADGANERKARLRAAGIDDLAPLSDCYGSGNLLIKVVKYGGKKNRGVFMAEPGEDVAAARGTTETGAARSFHYDWRDRAC